MVLTRGFYPRGQMQPRSKGDTGTSQRLATPRCWHRTGTAQAEPAQDHHTVHPRGAGGGWAKQLPPCRCPEGFPSPTDSARLPARHGSGHSAKGGPTSGRSLSSPRREAGKPGGTRRAIQGRGALPAPHNHRARAPPPARPLPPPLPTCARTALRKAPLCSLKVARPLAHQSARKR